MPRAHSLRKKELIGSFPTMASRASSLFESGKFEACLNVLNERDLREFSSSERDVRQVVTRVNVEACLLKAGRHRDVDETSLARHVTDYVVREETSGKMKTTSALCALTAKGRKVPLVLEIVRKTALLYARTVFARLRDRTLASTSSSAEVGRAKFDRLRCFLAEMNTICSSKNINVERTTSIRDENGDRNEPFWTLHIVRCVSLLADGRFAKAEQELMSYRNKNDVVDPTESYLLAMASASMGQYDVARSHAIQSLEAFRRLHPSQRSGASTSGQASEQTLDVFLGSLLFVLGRLNMLTGHENDALICFRTCWRRRLRCAFDARNAEGATLAQSDRTDRAIETFQDIVRLESSENRSMALLNLALVYSRLGHHTKSNTILRQLLKEHQPRISSDASTLSTRDVLLELVGDSAVRLGDFKRAYAAYEEISERHGHDIFSRRSIVSLRKLAFSCLQNGRYENALTYTQRVLDAAAALNRGDEECVPSLMYGADALVCLDRARDALSYIERALKSLNRPRAESNIQCVASSGSRDGTRTAARAWTEARIAAMNNKALLLVCTDRVDEAIELLRTLANVPSSNVPESVRVQVHFNYTLALWRADQRVRACVHWLGVRGFVSSVTGELSPHTAGHLDRFLYLLKRQRADLVREMSRVNVSTSSREPSSPVLSVPPVRSHVCSATASIPSTGARVPKTMSKDRHLRNSVSLVQLLGLDVTVLAHWCDLQKSRGMMACVARAERALGR